MSTNTPFADFLIRFVVVQEHFQIGDIAVCARIRKNIEKAPLRVYYVVGIKRSKDRPARYVLAAYNGHLRHIPTSSSENVKAFTPSVVKSDKQYAWVVVTVVPESITEKLLPSVDWHQQRVILENLLGHLAIK